MPNGSDSFVSLPGLMLPVEAVRLALDLENRGFRMTLDADDVLVAGPRERLTDEDRALIRRWKSHLRAIVAYDADVHGRTQRLHTYRGNGAGTPAVRISLDLMDGPDLMDASRSTATAEGGERATLYPTRPLATRRPDAQGRPHAPDPIREADPMEGRPLMIRFSEKNG